MQQDRMIATNAARWLIKRAAESGELLTNMKLQKLLYYAHGFALVRNGVGISREPLQAWEHGPVAPEQYRMFSAFDRDPIPASIADGRSDVPGDVLEVLDDVWAKYGQYSAAELRKMSHQEAPWRSTYQDGVRDLEIADQVMLDYFRTVPAALPANEPPSAFAQLLDRLRAVKHAQPERRSRGDLSEMLDEHRDLEDLRLAANARDFE